MAVVRNSRFDETEFLREKIFNPVELKENNSVMLLNEAEKVRSDMEDLALENTLENIQRKSKICKSKGNYLKKEIADELVEVDNMIDALMRAKNNLFKADGLLSETFIDF